GKSPLEPLVHPWAWTCKTCKPECFWIGIDYQMWWFRRGPVPGPLVTRGFAGDPIPGAPGQPGTRVVFGDTDINYNMIPGLRGEVGFWLDDDNRYSLEIEGFATSSRNQHLRFASDDAGNPLIGRVFRNTETNRLADFFVSFPGVLTGSTDIEMPTQMGG